MSLYDTREGARLALNRVRKGGWNRWGPYLAERAWGTVREDYSPDGDAWEYFPHDHARSRAYRWNEDGLGGICDRHQYLCFALALWNGRDPFLKERMFGLTGPEGNHGEDVKEYWFYLDSTPTHSYMRYLYKYPQAEYPYARLVEESRKRTREDPEFELVDTGIFDEGRYFDVGVEYAKAGPEDLLIRDHRGQPRPGGRAGRPPPDALVPEHLALGSGRRGSRRSPARPSGAARRLALVPRRLRALRRRSGRAAVHRERDELLAALRHTLPDAVRQGRLPRRGRRWASRGGEPGGSRHEGRFPVPASRRGGGDRHGRAPAREDAGREAPRRALRGIRGDRSGSAGRRPTSSTGRSCRRTSPTTRGSWRGRPSPGCSGRSSTTTSS